jgi:hypothetical protein
MKRSRLSGVRPGRYASANCSLVSSHCCLGSSLYERRANRKLSASSRVARPPHFKTAKFSGRNRKALKSRPPVPRLSPILPSECSPQRSANSLGRVVAIPSLWPRPGAVLQKHVMGVSRQLDRALPNFRFARDSGPKPGAGANHLLPCCIRWQNQSSIIAASSSASCTAF